MKSKFFSIKSLLILSLLFVGFACTKSNVAAPEFTVVSKPEETQLLIGSKIDIDVEYSTNTDDLDIHWFVNGKSYILFPDFTYEATKEGKLEIKLIVSNEAGAKEQDFVYNIYKKTYAPTIEVIKKTEPSVVKIGTAIEIEVAYSQPTKNLEIQWTINGQAYTNLEQFYHETEKVGELKIGLTAKNSTGTATQEFIYNVEPIYQGGYFIVNEGWFGHENGSVNYYIPSENKIITNAFDKSNVDFGATSTVGEVVGSYLYVVSKMKNVLVKCNIHSFKNEQALDQSQIGGDQAYGFAAIDENTALMSSSKGLYSINLAEMKVSKKLFEGTYGDLFVENGYAYAVSRDRGLEIIKIADFSVVKTIAGVQAGFAKTSNNKLYAVGGNKLIEINLADNKTTEIQIPFSVNGAWGAWRPGSICSSNANEVFIAKVGSWGGGQEIFRYVDGDATSLNKAFAKGTGNDAFYGAGIGFDKVNNMLLANFVDSGWGASYSKNRLVSFDVTTGAEKSRYVYPKEHYWFPSMFVFE